MEKFENKIIDMRDMYEERKLLGLPMMVEDNDDLEPESELAWVCFVVCFCCIACCLFLLLPFFFEINHGYVLSIQLIFSSINFREKIC